MLLAAGQSQLLSEPGRASTSSADCQELVPNIRGKDSLHGGFVIRFEKHW